MPVPTSDDLQRARDRLIALDRERAELRATIAGLERAVGGPQIGTAEGRVALFSSLFRGRTDVFATRWQSRTKPGVSGWAPRCANEWKPGVCEKPRIKCGACGHRRFVALSDAELRKHLEGRQTIGIYPLLADERCWFVAIDLDGPTWREDAGAVRDAAAEHDVPVLVERSRSGEGARLAGRVEIPVSGLPSELRDRLRRTAAFANPVFFEREHARLSTHNVPRVIACHEETGDRLLLPRGCLDDARAELDAAGIALQVEDVRSDCEAIDVAFSGALSAEQQRAVEALAGHDMGVLVAPPGSGKTVMAAALIARRGRSTLVLVHRRPLLEQWIKRLCQFLDLGGDEVGSPTEPGRLGIDVGTVQALTRRDDLPQLLGRYGHVIVDECHHVPAVSIERLLRAAPVRHITGLTATPRRRDGHHPIIAMQCGPVRHTLTTPTAAAVPRVIIERRTAFDPEVLPTDPGIQEILGAIAADRDRTKRIADDVVAELGDGRFPLVLTERREHLEALARLLEPAAPALVMLHGGIGARARRRADELLAGDGPRVVLATGRYIGEGFDDPRLDTLVLAMPIAWNGTVTQYAGRLHRHHEAKHEIRILDYVDHEIPVLRRMYAKRRRAYERLGYRPG